MSAAKLFPDAELVGEETKGDPAVFEALMLEEQVDEGFGRGCRGVGRGERNPVKAVALGSTEAFVDIGAGNVIQAGPGEEADDGGRKVLPEKSHRGLLVLEAGLGELVMWLM